MNICGTTVGKQRKSNDFEAWARIREGKGAVSPDEVEGERVGSREWANRNQHMEFEWDL